MAGGAARVTGRGRRGGLRDAEPDLQRNVVADGQVSDELDSGRAEPTEAGRHARVPSVARVAEQREPQLVGAQGEMSERLADEGEPGAVLDARRGGAAPPHGVPPASAQPEAT